MLEGNSLSEMLLPFTLVIASLNLLAPFVSGANTAARGALLSIVSLMFFANILLIDVLFIDGLKFSAELFALGKFSIGITIEPMGLVFLNMLGLLWNFALPYTTEFLKINSFANTSRFLFFFNACVICGVMVAVSKNLFTMFVFYELLTICTIPLIAHQSTEKIKQGLIRYLSILMTSSLVLFLPAVIIVYILCGHGNFESGGVMVYSGITPFYLKLLLVTFIFGIAKAALFPLHSWLPAAMVASYPVSALLHAVVVVKTGLFCILKILVYIFGIRYLQQIFSDCNWLIAIPIFTIIYSSWQAIRYKKIKVILAYSTINQLSIALLSAFLLTDKAIAASILHMVSHAMTKISLFYCAGSVYSVRRANNVSDFKSAYYFMPKVSAVFLVAGLSLIGIPPFAGFVSKFYIMLAAAELGNILVMLIIVISSLFSAVYILKMLIFVYHSSPGDQRSNFIRNDRCKSNGIISESVQLPNFMTLSLILCVCSVMFFIFLQKLIYKFFLPII